ncbi:MAG: hypothetical protein LBJ80_01970 [Rickettsiales bacterium]|jgi:hypothetical protein|nr:hypothetical protein [Rickettsiales bacterium]MDR1261170.1 hypothetical protein [Rickettsiales bacterium]
MELKKSNNIFNVKKTDNDTIIETINGQQRTLGNVPKRRPTAIETFIEKHIADIKKCDDEIANALASQRSRGYGSVRQSMLIKRVENLSNIVEIMKTEHAKGKYDNSSVSAIKEQVDIVKNAHEELSDDLKKLSDSTSNTIKLMQEQKGLKEEIHELKKEELRSHYRREKASNKNTVTTDNNKKIAIMEAKVNENDINIKSFRGREKVK